MRKTSWKQRKTCVKQAHYSTSFFSEFLTVGNSPVFYSTKPQVLHSYSALRFINLSLLFGLFTHNPQALLLKLLIYLKKG